MKPGDQFLYAGHRGWVDRWLELLVFIGTVLFVGIVSVAAWFVHMHDVKQCHDRGGVLVRSACLDPKALR